MFSIYHSKVFNNEILKHKICHVSNVVCILLCLTDTAFHGQLLWNDKYKYVLEKHVIIPVVFLHVCHGSAMKHEHTYQNSSVTKKFTLYSCYLKVTPYDSCEPLQQNVTEATDIVALTKTGIFTNTW